MRELSKELIDRAIATRLVIARQEKGLTQVELADKAGVNKVTVWKAESGAGMRASTVVLLSCALGLPPSYLLQISPQLKGINDARAVPQKG